MGLFIYLTVQLDRIEPAEWENAYQESLVLIKDFPAQLFRAGSERIGKHQRYFFTDQIVCNAGKENEYWSICGDRDSNQHAEAFDLHRQPQRNLRLRTSDNLIKSPEVDVLLAGEKMIDYAAGSGVDLFGNKTQGYPCHLALLAVAMLFEHRFPGRCFVFGDIDIESAQQVVRWVNTLLPTKIGLPVCCDGPALYQRLAVLYNTTDLLIERFETLFLGSSEETLQVLLAHIELGRLSNYVAVKLNDFDSLSQLGAIRILSTYLSVTQNLDAVIDLVRIANRFRTKSEFSLEALLNVLCHGFVTIDIKEREPLFALSFPSDHLKTINDSLSQVFMSLSGAPKDIAFYVNKEVLLETFVRYAPEQREQFQEIIAAEENHCRMSLAAIINAASKEKSEDESVATLVNEDEGVRIGHVLEKGNDANGMHGTYNPEADIPGVGYIIQQIEAQRNKTPPNESTIEMIGQSLDNIIRKNPDDFGSVDRKYYLDMIGWAGAKHGIRLWHKAWKDIDEETDIEVLKRLTALFLITEQALNFWNLRSYILEHKNVWPLLLSVYPLESTHPAELA